MPASDSIDPAHLPGSGRIIIAFSGGPDSVCLLHRLVVAQLPRELVCIHIDHRMDAESPDRARAAVDIAAGLGIDCTVVPVTVKSGGRGLEAEAREARYRALERFVADEDVLVTAHHADDHSETIILRLLRGAGPAGLAGIPRRRRFGRGWLYRPLLDWRRQDIENWLEKHRLESIRDPANRLPDFDRNHIRHHVLPLLRQRWPGADAALKRSSTLCSGAADFIARSVQRDLERAASNQGGPLDATALSDASAYYLGEIIRAWCIQQHFDPPPGRQLEEFCQQYSQAAPDRGPLLTWDGAELRAWRRHLWLQQNHSVTDNWQMAWDGCGALELPGGTGVLSLDGAGRPALDLTVSAGQPGDRIRPAGHRHTRPCKQLLAEAGVPPWQRNHWPRLWYRNRLAALGARWLTDEFQALVDERGQRLDWLRPAWMNTLKSTE